MEDLWIAAEDGLKLHVLSNGMASKNRLPVFCLPGISRTVEDFRTLLSAFAKDSQHSRHAYALDSRGRGLSERDPNPSNYSVPIELRDLITVLGELKIGRAIFIGTSRGGILTMVLASIMPQLIAGAVLNDVGPVLEMKGLLRIKSYVGKIPHPQSWKEAITSLKKIMGTDFPAFSEKDWKEYAERTWDKDFKLRSDPAISAAFDGIDRSSPPPTLWPQFDALIRTAPVLILRGEHSDLLSRETSLEMKRQGADRASLIEILGQGHAPILERQEVIQAMLDFVNRIDPV